MKNHRTAAMAVLVLLGGCGRQQPQAPNPGPPQVGYVVVQPHAVTLTSELPGRTTAYETSEVRPQVDGLVLERLFQEGDVVRQGQPLYRIDPQPYEAAVASARAALTRSRAAIGSTSALARRYGELVKINAIARQEYENAVTGAAQSRADVAAQQAALRTAQINLGRTMVRAPISGRIGRSVYTTGALVTAAQANPLTTIQRLDPIYVDVTQSSADILRLRQQAMAGQISRAQGGAARVRLQLEDGSSYPVEGTLKFADVTVDPSTGAQTIRAVFPNPQGLLLPGMYVRASLVEGTQSSGITVPERAVGRDERGNATVMVVGADGKATVRPITAPRTIGTEWLVTQGLQPGDKVIVEGTVGLRPGTPVKPVPWRPGAGAGPQAAPAGQAR